MLTASRLRARRVAAGLEPAPKPVNLEWPKEAIERVEDLERQNARLRRDLLKESKRADSCARQLEVANGQLLRATGATETKEPEEEQPHEAPKSRPNQHQHGRRRGRG